MLFVVIIFRCYSTSYIRNGRTRTMASLCVYCRLFSSVNFYRPIIVFMLLLIRCLYFFVEQCGSEFLVCFCIYLTFALLWLCTFYFVHLCSPRNTSATESRPPPSSSDYHLADTVVIIVAKTSTSRKSTNPEKHSSSVSQSSSFIWRSP